MKSFCKKIQYLLAENGPLAIKEDKKAADHLVSCTDCFSFFESLSEVETSLSTLPPLDAPDELVERVIKTVRQEPVQVSKNTDDMHVESSILSFIKKTGNKFRSMFSSHKVIGFGFSGIVVVILAIVITIADSPSVKYGKTFSIKSKQNIARKAKKAYLHSEEKTWKDDFNKEIPKKIMIQEPSEVSTEEDMDTPASYAKKPAAIQVYNQIAGSKTLSDDYNRLDEQVSGKLAESNLPKLNIYMRDAEIKNELSKIVSEKEEVPSNTLYKRDKQIMSILMNNKNKISKKKKYEKPGGLKSSSPGRRRSENYNRDNDGERLLKQFTDDRMTVTGLTYKEPSGYWTNTYVPGDPMFRQLGTHLQRWNRTTLQEQIKRRVYLDDSSQMPTQPFDPPENAALGVYLSSDLRGIQGESRMLIQVGIKGTSMVSGIRPAMNVGIVLDARGDYTSENIQNIRTLLLALGKAKDIGDRFSLTVAGKPGGMIIAPGDFKYGQLLIAMQRIFKEKPAVGNLLTLQEAMKNAIESVSSIDDPASPLGSSVVILVTTQPLNNNTNIISNMAHKSAVAGVPVSVIGVGSHIKVDEIDRIILAGQGNRRLLKSPEEAKGLVNRELSAISKIVARAVRLRIRLAPGVKLVDILGANSLDEQGAQKVRDAEKSIDLRISRNLGIIADRGDDEDGVQIIIPAFYAGDSHVILLDVVASRPGPLADVTVRYKDLVNLKNSVVRVTLTADRTKSDAGPLERNVLKNLFAYNLSKILLTAAEELKRGNDQKAKLLLKKHYAFLQSVRSSLPGFQRDQDISNDIDMLSEYITFFNNGTVSRQEQRLFFAESLQYAGHLKVLPRPEKSTR